MIERLEELSSLLFGGSGTEEVNNSDIKIIYGTALTASVNGEVTVSLDDGIYSINDDDDNYQFVSLTDEEDSVSALDEEYEEEEEETVY